MNVNSLDTVCSEPVQDMEQPFAWGLRERTALSKDKYLEIRNQICSFKSSKDISLTSRTTFESALKSEQLKLLSELKSAREYGNFLKMDRLAEEASFRLKQVEHKFPSKTADLTSDDDRIRALARVHVVRRPPADRIGMSHACKHGIAGIAELKNGGAVIRCNEKPVEKSHGETDSNSGN